MADRDDITSGEDPADTTERRDWDLPPAEDSGTQEEPAVPHGLTDPGPEPPFDRREPAPEPADESERRDWDMP